MLIEFNYAGNLTMMRFGLGAVALGCLGLRWVALGCLGLFLVVFGCLLRFMALKKTSFVLAHRSQTTL
jgi:hypothetical protein